MRQIEKDFKARSSITYLSYPVAIIVPGTNTSSAFPMIGGGGASGLANAPCQAVRIVQPTANEKIQQMVQYTTRCFKNPPNFSNKNTPAVIENVFSGIKYDYVPCSGPPSNPLVNPPLAYVEVVRWPNASNLGAYTVDSFPLPNVAMGAGVCFRDINGGGETALFFEVGSVFRSYGERLAVARQRLTLPFNDMSGSIQLY
jgi:hypothetical protein